MPNPQAPTWSILVALCLVVVSSSAFCRTQGTKILDVNGNNLFLKGIGIANWLNPEGYMMNLDNINSFRSINLAFSELLNPHGATQFWGSFRTNFMTSSDFKYIKSVGFNLVRLPFDYKLLMTEEGNIKESGWKWLDFSLQQCKINNLYLVLDMHSAPGGQTGANIDDSYGYPFLYNNDYFVNMTVTLWTEIAKRYRNQQMILGYELLNEPISTDFNTSQFIPLLEPLYKKITAAIRAVDNNHIIILDGAVWASQFYSAFGKPFASNLVYTYHKYWVDPTQGNIQEYINFGKQYNVPIWMGESGENSVNWISTFRQLLEANGVGWAFWPYKKFSADSCVRTINPPSYWNQMVKYIEGDRKNLDAVAKNRPPFSQIKTCFDDFIKNIEFGATHQNNQYIKALGLKA